MAARLGLSTLGALVVGLFAACSPAVNSGQPTDPNGPCSAGATMCNGNSFNVCDANGSFQAMASCGAGMVCDNTLGCVQCTPGGPTCSGNEVHQCSATGTLGALVQTCNFGQTCSAGACIDSCELAASDFIYLVDDNNNFLSFAPRNDKGAGSLAKDLFTKLGTLDCRTARPAFPGFSNVSPFSMAVDRHAVAWVLYDTGEMFNVNPQTAACSSVNYTPVQLGWEVFGMGYVSDAPGAKTDTLYVGRATVNNNTDNSLGKIDKSLLLSRIGGFTGVSHSPEMTGTANAELYGYFPSNMTNQHVIALIDRTNATFSKTYQLQPLPSADQNYAFAFAHWGGRFYYFINMQLNSGSRVSRVYRYDPGTNVSTLILDNSPYVIVGAGVSTCAPTQIG